MKKKQTKYEPAEKTFSQFYCLAFLKILQVHLKYVNDPEGMLRDQESRIFALPFLDYAKGSISFAEADRRINDLRSTIPWFFAIHGRENALRIQHKKISDGDLEKDLLLLKNNDNKIAEEAALRIIKSFPQTKFKFAGIKNVMAKAIVKEEFFEAFHKIQKNEHTRRDFGLVCFRILNEEIFKDPNLTEADVIKMAREQKLFFQSDESLLKYLRREGIKIRSTKRSPQPPGASRLDTLREYFEGEAISAKKHEFKKYLFGDTSIQRVKREFALLKKSLRIS
jgi:hypothetical protein